MPEVTWKKHIIRAGTHCWEDDEAPDDPVAHGRRVEPWLAALLQAEHLSLLVGSGLTTAAAFAAGTTAAGMATIEFDCEHADAVNESARVAAAAADRGAPNIEDQIRAARQLIDGLSVLSRQGNVQNAARASELRQQWQDGLGRALSDFLESLLETERNISAALVDTSTDDKIRRANEVRRLLGAFLLTFASRATSRERLNIFTTNYDRLLEYLCDLLGLRIIDRFVGTLAPVFRSSRLGVDLHYNPPGIRGEPRYLEGVVRLSKLHGSLDWRYGVGASGRPEVARSGVPFGAAREHQGLPESPLDTLMIYPNPAKDAETLEFPYADLFRDCAAAVSRPNSVVFTYGYGFGDDHINRILRDALTIPSMHLAIIAFDDVGGRIRAFCEGVAREEQITLLIGPHAGNLPTLVKHYLPKPAIDRTTWRMVELLKRRSFRPDDEPVVVGSPEGDGP